MNVRASLSAGFAKQAIVALAVTLVIVSAVRAQPLPPPGEWTNIPPEGVIDSDKVGPIGLAAVAASADGAPGVLLQATAIFISRELEQNVADLDLKWYDAGDGSQQVAVCQGTNIHSFQFPEEDAIRLAYWVATSEWTIAFGLIPDGNRFRASLLKSGYERAKGERRLPVFTQLVISATREESGEDDLIHPRLNSPLLVRLLSYVDYADGNIAGYTKTDNVLVEKKEGDAFVKEMNAGKPEGAGTPVTVSYTNTDVHSKFDIRIDKATDSGLPLRYYWLRHSNDGGVNRFHRVMEFRDPQTLHEEFAKQFGEDHRLAVDLFRLTAVFRAFHQKNPEKLRVFINQGLDRLRG